MVDARYESFLEAHGAKAAPHSGRTLYEHLKGTYDLLRDWGAPKHVQLAGLFHSIYGTQYFGHASVPLTERHKVRALIGDTAERLVFAFCTDDRRRLLKRPAYDLLEIEAANLLDQGGPRDTLERLMRCPISASARSAIARHLFNLASPAPAGSSPGGTSRQ